MNSIGLKEEYKEYLEKTKLEKPFTYNYFTVLRYELSLEEVIKKGRESFIRGGGREKLSQDKIDYIIYCYQHRAYGDWATRCAKVIDISVGSGVIYRYLKKYKNDNRI